MAELPIPAPLNYLIRPGHVNTAPELYGRVLVPAAVLVEMLHPMRRQRSECRPQPRSLTGERVQILALDASLAVKLGRSEREAISLALEHHADVLLIDERVGREQVQARHLGHNRQTGRSATAARAGRLEFPTALKQLQRFGFCVAGACRFVAGELHPKRVAARVPTIKTLLRIAEALRKKIGSDFGQPELIFRCWLHALSGVRNICAYHGDLWNRDLGVKPKLPDA